MDQSDAGTGTGEKSSLRSDFRQYGAEESPHRKLMGNSIAISFCNEPEIFGLEWAILCWIVARSRPWPPRTFVAFFALSVSFAAELGRLRSAFSGKEGIIENEGIRSSVGVSRLRRKCLRPGGIPGRIPP